MLGDGPSVDPTVVYRQLYDAHAGQVLSYLTNQLRDYEAAQDVAQDTWINALRGLPATLAKGQGVSKAWVMRAATNAMIDHLRRIKARPQTQDIDEALAPGSAFPTALMDGETPERAAVGTAEHDEHRATAALLLELLPRDYRRVLWLYEWRGYPYEQIATALETTVPGVKSRLYRARNAQRVLWERDQPTRTRRETVRVRLWRFVEGGEAWARAHPDECWLWLGAYLGNGYPCLHIVSHRSVLPGTNTLPRRTVVTSRLLYSLVRGALPPWACVSPCQSTRRCVNPFHAHVVSKQGPWKVRGALYERADPTADRAESPAPGSSVTVWPAGGDLRRRRLSLAVSVRLLAAEAGVSASTISHTERGRLVLPEVLAAVVKALTRLEARLTPVTIRIPEDVRTRREAAGLIRQHLAVLSGVNHTSLGLFEQGRAPLGLQSLRRLQDAFDRLEQERQEGVA